MDILRFITAGSVDDGKSTLIGRLLYDSKSILQDQLEVLEKHSKNKNDDGVDLALLTDGLRAEREQGITIDVAYRYFSTARRKFIIADAPGHVQYTRNMITGASNSDLMVILIDARQGVIEQTRRHSIIASLLNLKKVAVAINKMDLVDYSEQIYENIKADYAKIAENLGLTQVTYFPISALKGDNIVTRSADMDWYNGISLLEYLEEVEVNTDTDINSRFQVQYVIRPQNMKYFADSYENNEQGEMQFDELHDYRGYAGKILSGDFRKGDRIQILPTEISTKIDRIEINGSEVEEAFEGQSVVLHIEDDIDVSRGDFFVSAEQLPQVEKEVEVLLCWLDQKALQPGNKYILQHHSRLIKALVKDVEYKVNVNTLEHEKADGDIKLNEIVKVTLKTAQPLVFDSFRKNKATGSAILVDETSNSTVAACIIQ
ncbi:TPA: GTP-binding protein [Elizabethkingia anophelis]|uniref:sulfate adenylyltransferase n=1 Tax=Elizabethkingia anophelis R26 TaxID=1246994 RepID=A0ABM6MSJ3_9FLAO|nr:GTP-binding protein [Elizabethkingia anophelis]ATC36089.1 sulfate adenylyltransferase [Elizabethkingia anophelis R26]ATC39766.1 sulfate adenylyltransferase [Elizabethkingia anophelis Ag1]ATC43445.1 sulfate adenylyltransferase [Elizabethkingia anophelis]ATC47121.1 sulfate adenylyltransferase [Elizabethkingia anophelis]ELR80683.1 sulfate adenylyltransferase, large subunit [Elizabethkingia anophelis R26]